MAMPPPLPPRQTWREPDIDDLDDQDEQDRLPQRHKLATTSLTLAIIAVVAGVIGLGVTYALVSSGEPIPEEGQEGDEILAFIGLFLLGSAGCAVASAAMAFTGLGQIGRSSPPQTGKGALIASAIISVIVTLWWIVFFGVLAPLADN